MKTIYLIFLGFAVHLGVSGQNIEKTIPSSVYDGTLKTCGEYEALQKMRKEDPERYRLYVQGRAAFEKEAPVLVEKSGTIYTIPVVFHILHNNGTENISDAQVQDALNILNKDFRKLNSDVNNVVAQFQAIAGDAEIEFAFAKIAPDGTCFEGITRTTSSQTTNEDGQIQLNAIINGNDVYQGIWPHNKYLNIYVCRNLIEGAAGYTFKPNNEGYVMAGAPATAANMYYNGIFMLYDYIGSIGTSHVMKSRTLSHEVGHWLNLSHTWGDDPIGTCGTDFVSDTPQTEGSPSVCTLSKSSCDATLDNVENYMDYSYCSKMFTQGQVTRMRAAITNALGGRDNIWTTANLQSVGVIAGGTSLCSADIEATQTGLCVGNSTIFSVIADDPISVYSWSFPGGTPATSASANPTVTYNTPGTYQVSVTITTASGNSTLTKPAYINVATSQTPVALPIEEGFVNVAFPPSNWTIDNGGTSNTWVRNGSRGTSPSEGNSAMIDFYNYETTGEVDDLNTPAFSLSGYSAASLTFDVAYQPYNSSFFDKLEVLVSPGCGMAFEVVYSKEGTTLQTQAANQTGYTNPTQWRNETINLTSYLGSSEVKIKFRGISGYGNYLYIDNINISGTSGTPTANFTSSSGSTCVGETVTFTDNSTGATSWSWDFGTGATPATAIGAGPHVVTYSTSGSKQVSLSVNSGASSTNQTVSVNNPPTVIIGALPAVCASDSPITLTQGNPVGGTYSGTGVSGNQFSPSVAGLGTHTITYEYIDGNGCSGTATGQIVVDDCSGTPTANFTSSSGSTCVGETVTFTDNSTGAISWSWDFGTGATPATAIGSGPHVVTYSTSGSKQVSLSVNSGASSSNQTVSVNNPPTVVLMSLPIVCASDSPIILTQGNPVGGTYSGTGVSGNQFSPSVAGLGTYTITYEYTDGNGCSGTATGQIVVNDCSGTPTANFTSSSGSTCVGETVTFTDNSTGAISWSWDFGTGATPATAIGSGPHVVTYSTSGSKQVSLSVNSGASSSNQTVSVNNPPTVVLVSLPTVCASDSPITLTQGNPVGGTYSGAGVSGDQFSPSAAGLGTHTITYEYTDGNGCSGTATGQIVVNDCSGTPTANFTSSSGNACIGETVTFTDNSTGAVSWSWDFGTGATPATAIGSGPHVVTYSTSGSKQVSLSINSGASSSNQTVSVNNPPTVIIGALPAVCVSDSPITLTQGNPVGGIYSGTGVSGDQFSPSAAGLGTHTITYEYTSGNGCSGTSTGQIWVDACSGGASANFTSSSGSACVGETVTFTDNSTGAISWSWDFGTGASPATAIGSGPHVVTYSTSGSKQVSLIVNGGVSNSNQTVNVNVVPPAPSVSVVDNCGSSLLIATGTGFQWSTGATSSSITVTSSNPVSVTQSDQGCVSSATSVIPDPKPLPTVTLGILPTVCIHDSPITLNQGNPAGGTYSGTGIVGGDQFSPSQAGLGSQTITYLYTSSNGCSNTDTGQILVDECLSLEAEGNTLFSVSPNPTTGNVTVKSSFSIDEINVLDNTGRVVEKIDGNQLTEIQINLNHLSTGSYHIYIKMDSSVRVTKLIIK